MLVGTQQPAQTSHSQCGRTQSLRCQTPSSFQQQNPHRFYGCGDPWCHHLGQGDDYLKPWNISPVPEGSFFLWDCLSLSNIISRVPALLTSSKSQVWGDDLRSITETSPMGVTKPQSSTETVTGSTDKKDASVQTFEMVDKCTSPFLRMNSGDSIDRSWKRYQRRGYTEPISRKNQSSVGSFTPDSLDSSVKVAVWIVESCGVTS